eukprot:1772209-Pleurochrysis_carterae.AAC.3
MSKVISCSTVAAVILSCTPHTATVRRANGGARSFVDVGGALIYSLGQLPGVLHACVCRDRCNRLRAHDTSASTAPHLPDTQHPAHAHA